MYRDRIYLPHIAEIYPLMTDFRLKHIKVPGLPKRAEKAEQILLGGGVHWSDGWHVLSQSELKFYRVNGECNCPDHGVILDCDEREWTLCKHKIAIYAYKKILLNHLNALAESPFVEKFDVYQKDDKGYTFTNELAQFEFSQWLATGGAE